jgi:hypothetical protein
MSYRGLLAELLLAECDDRARRRSERRIDPAVVHTLAKCEWVKKGQPLG